jgi:hypothetical protein
MLHQILETDWLSELSDEQQEIVAGGGQLADIDKEIQTAFEASNTLFRNQVKSGPEGSFVTTQIANVSLDTVAEEALKAALPSDSILAGTEL